MHRIKIKKKVAQICVHIAKLRSLNPSASHASCTVSKGPPNYIFVFSDCGSATACVNACCI